MELIHAYPLPESGHSYRRQVILDKENECVTVRDTTDCSSVILNFITYERPEYPACNTGSEETDGRVIRLGDACLAYTGAELLAAETLPITDPRLQAAWDHELYRIRLTMTEKEFTLNIR